MFVQQHSLHLILGLSALLCSAFKGGHSDAVYSGMIMIVLVTQHVYGMM